MSVQDAQELFDRNPEIKALVIKACHTDPNDPQAAVSAYAAFMDLAGIGTDEE